MTILGIRISGLILALVSILLSMSAQLLMKIGMNNLRIHGELDGPMFQTAIRVVLNPWVFGGLAAYGASAVLWLGVLSQISLSIAYPLVSLGICGVVLLSWLLLSEPLPLTRLLGVGLIVVGVLLVGASR